MNPLDHGEPTLLKLIYVDGGNRQHTPPSHYFRFQLNVEYLEYSLDI